MKNLNITDEQYKKVANILKDNNWDYQYCASHAGCDIYKAIDFLETQRFSVEKLKEFSHLIDSSKKEVSVHNIARDLADPLAWDRIARFNWSIDESVSFLTI